MDEFNTHDYGGSLHISSDVVEKIAQHAVMEVDGVAAVSSAGAPARSLLGKIAMMKPIKVEMKEDVATIEVALVVKYGTKIPELSEQVQQNVKEAVQSMTGITVAKVDVMVVGVDLQTVT